MIRGFWMFAMVGCSVGVVPGSDDADGELPDGSPDEETPADELEESEGSDACRGCGSSSSWPTTVSLEIAFQLDPDLAAALEDAPAGVFSGSITDSVSTWTLDLDTPEIPLDGSSTAVVGVIEVSPSSPVEVGGFLDLDGDGVLSEGDLLASPDDNTFTLPSYGPFAMTLVLTD